MFSLSFSADSINFLASCIHLCLIRQTQINSTCTFFFFTFHFYNKRGCSSCQQLISLPTLHVVLPPALSSEICSTRILSSPHAPFPKSCEQSAHLKQNKTKKPSTHVFPWLISQVSSLNQPPWKSFLNFLSPHPQAISILQAIGMCLSSPDPASGAQGMVLTYWSDKHFFLQISFALQHYRALCTTQSWKVSLLGSLSCTEHPVFSFYFFRHFLWVSLAGSSVSAQLLNVHTTHSLVPFLLLPSWCVLNTSAAFCLHCQQPRFQRHPSTQAPCFQA